MTHSTVYQKNHLAVKRRHSVQAYYTDSWKLVDVYWDLKSITLQEKVVWSF